HTRSDRDWSSDVCSSDLPSHELPEAMAAGVAELRQPRPYISRYPIPEEEFQRLKEKATRLRLPLGRATLSRDSGQKAEIATRGEIGRASCRERVEIVVVA